ncbi:response regulator [Orbaceae bacterium ESL0727]|nr:response regulator [Orbaceae bacterium ESL0727]
MNKLLIVDDDTDITLLLKELLELEGFQVETANNGIEALTKFDETIDLILLDIMMPEVNGFSVLSQLRSKCTVPVIFLTAKDDECDKVIGLELGADDYVLKPFNDKELVARIRALLRRTYWGNQENHSDLSDSNSNNVNRNTGMISSNADSSHSETEVDQYIIDKLVVNCKQQSVYFDGNQIELTGMEFQVLLKLLENGGKIISRDSLSESVLGKEFMPLNRSIDVHVSNLRKKLPPRSDGLPWIKTLRSRGYLFIMHYNDNINE